MALKVPFASSLTILQAIIDALLELGDLHLYKSNTTPANGDNLGTYTEADFDGYSPISLTGWSAPALDAGNKASTELPFQDFSCTGSVTPNDIYGIFVTDPLGNLLYAERNPGGLVTINTAGQVYSYLPRFTDKSEF